MNLSNSFHGQVTDKRPGIVVLIAGVEVYVIQIQQEGTARSAADHGGNTPLGKWQRQQFMKVFIARSGPAKVIGNNKGFYAFNQITKSLKVVQMGPLGTADVQ